MNNLNVWISLVSISQLIDYFLSFLDIEKPLAQSLYSTCHCLSVFLYFTIFSQFILLQITQNQRLNQTSLKQYMNVLKRHQFLTVVC